MRSWNRARSWTAWYQVGVLALLLLQLFSTSAWAQRFYAETDRNTLAKGENLTLILVFEDLTPTSVPELPPLQDLQLVQRRISDNTQVINGEGRRVIQTLYTLRPARTGLFTIPSISVTLNQQKYSTEPVRFTVVDQLVTSEEGKLDGFVKLLPEKNTIYVGEVLPVEIQLFIRDGENIRLPQIKGAGFTLSPIVHTGQSRVRLGNVDFMQFSFKTFAIPARSGEVLLGPVEVALHLRTFGNRNTDDLDRPDLFARLVATNLVAAAAAIQVKELPEAPQGSEFSGAVGQYELEWNVTPTELAVGDPITVRLSLSGRGNLESLQMPEQKSWKGFKSYPPTSQSKMDASKTRGKKVFEQVLVPESAQWQELPGATFTFFNPTTEQYQTLKTESVKLTLKTPQGPVGEKAQPTIIAQTNPATGGENPELENDELRHISPILGVLSPLTSRWPAWLTLLSLEIIPTALLGFLWWRRIRRERLDKDPALRRRLATHAALAPALKQLHTLAGGEDPSDYFPKLFRLVQDQLGGLLRLPSAGITESVIEQRLAPLGVSDSVRAELHRYFQICHEARFAARRSSQDLRKLTADVGTTFETLYQHLT